MYRWPTSLSFGPSETELDSATLLEASCAHVAVDARAVLDLEALGDDVAVDLAGAAEEHLLARGHGTFDIAADGDARPVDQRLDGRPGRDVHGAADPELAFDAALHADAAGVNQAAVEAVTGAERELVLARVTLRFGAVFRFVVDGGFRHLSVHKTTPEMCDGDWVRRRLKGYFRALRRPVKNRLRLPGNAV